MNLNMTFPACRRLCRCRILNARWLRPVFAESYRWLRVNQANERMAVRVSNAPDQSLRLYCNQELCVVLAALSYNKNIVASSEQYCSFVSVSIT